MPLVSSTFSTATSCAVSAPTSVAVRAVPVPDGVTVIELASATTWALVRM